MESQVQSIRIHLTPCESETLRLILEHFRGIQDRQQTTISPPVVGRLLEKLTPSVGTHQAREGLASKKPPSAPSCVITNTTLENLRLRSLQWRRENPEEQRTGRGFDRCFSVSKEELQKIM
jgi:hypothetical protein